MQNVGLQLGEFDFQNYTALGFVVDEELVGGVIYHNMRGASIECSIAATTPRWCRRAVLNRIFGYPFIQLKRRVIVTICERRNKHSRKFTERLGFTLSGPIPHAHWSDDSMIYHMKREDCRWLEGSHG